MATDDITVLAIDGAFAQSCTPYLDQWVESGLVRAHILIGPDGRIAASSRIGTPGSSAVDTLASLGAHGVFVYALRESIVTSGPLEAVVRAISDATAAGTDEQPQIFRATQILCPPRHAEADVKEWMTLGPPWTDTLVVATDNRRDENAVTLDEESTEDLARRAIFGTLTTTGLLTGLEPNPLLSHPPVQTALPAVRVLRAFGRVICADPHLIPRLDAEIQAIQTDAKRLKDYVDGALPEDDGGQALVASLARSFVSEADGGALTLTTPEAAKNPAPTLVTLRLTLHMFANFFRSFFTRGIWEFADSKVEDAKARAVRVTNDYIYGENSAYKLSTAAERKHADLQRASAEAAQRASTARHSGEDLRSVAISLAAHPDLWREYRSAIFSLIDGGSAPSYLPQATFNDRPVIIADPEILAPKTPDADGARGCDVISHRKLLAAEAPSSSTPDETKPKSAKDASNEESGTGRSFSYLIATQLADNLETASAELDASLKELSALLRPDPPKTPEEVHKIQRSSRRRRIRLGLAVLSLLLLVIAPPLALVAGAISLVVWLILQVITVAWTTTRALLRFQRYLQRRFQREHELAVEVTQIDNLSVAIEHYSRAVIQLDARYAEMLAWTDLVSGFVRQPFSQVSDAPTEPTMPELPGPLSLAVADASLSVEHITRLGGALAARVFQRGWLNAVFVDCSQQLQSVLRTSGAGSRTAEGLDADQDVGARRGDIAALDMALQGQGRQSVLRDTRDDFVASLATGRLFDEPVLDRNTGESLTSDDFLAAIRPGAAHRPLDARLFAGDSAAAVVENAGGEDQAGRIPSGRAVTTSIAHGVAYQVSWRIDTSSLLSGSSLRAGWRTSEEEPQEVPARDDPDI